MSPPRPYKTLSTALALGLGLGVPSLAHAQQTNPGNTNISTGSGAGTSAGVSPGSSPSSTQIGNENLRNSSPGLGPQGTPGSRPPRTDPGGRMDAATGIPAAIDNQAPPAYTQAEMNAIDARILQDMRSVANPADRALGMDQVAMAKIASHLPGDNRLKEAHEAIAYGAEAALRIEDRVTRDLRLLMLVRTALLLADEQAHDGVAEIRVYDSRYWTPRRRLDWLQQAETERRGAGDLASRVSNPSLRSELLYRVVENTAKGSERVAQQAPLAGITQEGTTIDGQRMLDPKEWLALSLRLADRGFGYAVMFEVGRANEKRQVYVKTTSDLINRMADRGLVFAANDAQRISMPIWRDRAMVSIASAASASDQFERGIQICSTIPQPEYRADALIQLAETQARRNLDEAATATYRQAASAVASIPIADPRSILSNVLIDSLISVGRFDDARACVSFYPDDVRRAAALGRIAGNQGERRLAESALVWIERDTPPEQRDTLKLRVYQGVLRSYKTEKNKPIPAATTIRPAAR